MSGDDATRAVRAAGPGAAAAPGDGASAAPLAERVRAALIASALAAHEDARLQGLCMEGAWEAAVSAMRALDVATLSGEAPGGQGKEP